MSTSATNPSALVAQRRSLLWRVHFWAALIASPFAVLAALTGILYIFTPQIEAQLHGHLDTVAPVGVAFAVTGPRTYRQRALCLYATDGSEPGRSSGRRAQPWW
nr:PepSY-associated TM helix domain-containing protein [uncultured Rhodoferax sp.]